MIVGFFVNRIHDLMRVLVIDAFDGVDGVIGPVVDDVVSGVYVGCVGGLGE
jgi:phosphatidylglycerophosphatase A